MSRYYKIWIWCLLTLLSIDSVMGQQQFLSTPVSSKGLSQYEGRIDDINEVKIILTCSNNKCNGELVYLRSGDRFRLSGQQENNRLTLEEYDTNNQLTGYISGKFIGNAIDATWENANQTIGSKLYLTNMQDTQRDINNCGTNKWIQAYRGVIGDKEVEMILHKTDNHRVLGNVYYVKEKRSFAIRGILESNSTLNLNVVDAKKHRTIGSIRAIYRNGQELSASFYDTRNAQSFASFELLETLEVNCLEYADYYSSYDFLYPQSNDPLFNQIMTFLTKDWVADCKKQTKAIRKEQAVPVLRASQRGYSWTEVTLYKKDFISGLLTYNTTWNGKKSTKAFNYDFENKASIELEDVFKGGFDYKKFIKKYIKAELQKDATYKNDVSYQAWLDQQNFTLFTVGQDGMHFFTDFHGVYGRQSVVIPYKKLKSNIKRQAAIKRLL